MKQEGNVAIKLNCYQPSHLAQHQYSSKHYTVSELVELPDSVPHLVQHRFRLTLFTNST